MNFGYESEICAGAHCQKLGDIIMDVIWSSGILFYIAFNSIILFYVCYVIYKEKKSCRSKKGIRRKQSAQTLKSSKKKVSHKNKL